MKQAADKKADLVVFPEYFLCGGADLDVAAKTYDRTGEYRSKFQALAVQYNINIVPGTIMSANQDGPDLPPQNVACFIDRQGRVLGEYCKVCLS